jgi:hypothetical protein
MLLKGNEIVEEMSNDEVWRLLAVTLLKGWPGRFRRVTSPHRLSAEFGERMNQFADFENRQSRKQ